MTHYDIDHRIIYETQQSFFERIPEVYVGHKPRRTPPDFKDILSEFVDVEVLSFFDNNLDLFKDIVDQPVQEMRADIVHHVPESIHFISTFIAPGYLERYSRDLFLFLVHNQWFFFEKPTFHYQSFRHYNSPLQSVW